MKKIDLDSSKELQRFRNELNNVIDHRIAEAKTKESINAIDSLPFGTVKSIFESVSDKLYDTKEGKKIIAKYIKTLSENEGLLSLYSLHQTLLKENYAESPSRFLEEAISFFSPMIKKEKNIVAEKKEFCNVVKSAIKESKISSEEIEKMLSEEIEPVEMLDNTNTLKFMEYDNEVFMPQKVNDGWVIIHSIDSSVTRNFYDANCK